MSPYLLRSAAAHDSMAIRKLVYRTELTPFGLNWRRFIVALSSSGDLIGCGQIKTHKNHPPELASLTVEKEWRGKGVGQSIIKQLLTSHQGPLYLICQESMKSLYEKFGFRQLDEDKIPPYYLRVRKLSAWGNRLFFHKTQLIVMGKT